MYIHAFVMTEIQTQKRFLMMDNHSKMVSLVFLYQSETNPAGNLASIFYLKMIKFREIPTGLGNDDMLMVHMYMYVLACMLQYTQVLDREHTNLNNAHHHSQKSARQLLCSQPTIPNIHSSNQPPCLPPHSNAHPPPPANLRPGC